MIATSSISIYFIQLFFNRSDSTIISNFKTSEKGYIPNFHNFPIMIRLTLSEARKIEFPEKSWRLNTFLYTMNPKVASSYSISKINYKRCTKDRFKGYESLIEKISNLEEYFCFDFGENKFNLTGPYGSSGYHQFFSIRIRGCYEEVEGTECLSPSEVEKMTNDIFIDFRVLNTNIIHENINPVDEEILGHRIPISSTIFKRIFYKIQSVDYTTDFGYIFESQDMIHINQFTDYTVDSDFKFYNDISNPGYYKVFSIINVINTQTKMFYKRTYMKAQTLLANIGGIIKGITVIAHILINLISNRLLDLELCNQVHIKLQKVIRKDKSMLNSSLMINKKLDVSKDKINDSSIKIYDDVFNVEKIKPYSLNLRFHEVLIPLRCFCNKQKQNIFKTNLKIAYNTLSLTNLIAKLQEFEGIKRCILTENEICLFEETFNYKNLNNKIVSKFVSNNKSNVDTYSSKDIGNKLLHDLYEKIKN